VRKYALIALLIVIGIIPVAVFAIDPSPTLPLRWRPVQPVKQGNAIGWVNADNGEIWLAAVNDGVAPEDRVEITVRAPSSRTISPEFSGYKFKASVTINTEGAGIATSGSGIPLLVSLSLYKKQGANWIKVNAPFMWQRIYVPISTGSARFEIESPNVTAAGEEYIAAATLLLTSNLAPQKGDATAIFKFKCQFNYPVPII